MIYSVWNQGKGVYDYFQTPDVQEVANAPKPKHLKMRQLGMSPAHAAWPLPSGAKLIGSGEFARGRMAISESSRGMGSFGIEDLIFNPTYIAIGIAAFLWWKWRKR